MSEPIKFTPDAPYSYDPRNKIAETTSSDEWQEAFDCAPACHHPATQQPLENLQPTAKLPTTAFVIADTAIEDLRRLS